MDELGAIIGGSASYPAHGVLEPLRQSNEALMDLARYLIETTSAPK